MLYPEQVECNLSAQIMEVQIKQQSFHGWDLLDFVGAFALLDLF